MADALEGLKNLDREALMTRMAEELPEIREKLNVTIDALAEKTGIDITKLKASENGRRSLKWSEYLSLVFVIWNNNIGRGLLDSKGLFPDELKSALSVNRNAHAPVTESSKYGY